MSPTKTRSFFKGIFKTTPEVRHYGEAPEPVAITPGESHLVLHHGKRVRFRPFRDLADHATGWALSTTHPFKLRKDQDFTCRLTWLTETTSDEETLNPSRIGFEILADIQSYLKREDQPALLIDDLAHLVTVNGLEDTADFLQAVLDTISVCEATLIVNLDPDLVDPETITRIRTGFDSVIEAGVPRDHHMPERIRFAHSYAFEGSQPEEAFQLAQASGRPLLILSSTYPDKLRRRHDLGDTRIIWLTTTKKGDTPILIPERLGFEIQETLASYLRMVEGGLVVIDGIDVLLAANDSGKLDDFLKTITDLVAENGCSLIVTIPTGRIENQHRRLIESRCDFINQAGSLL